MLILNKKDMYQAADLDEIMDSIERAHILFRDDACFSPDRYSVTHDNKTMLYMPSYADGLIGTKMLAEFPENPAKGHPYLSGLMIINLLETGAVEAILNGEVITALRTGAVGGRRYPASGARRQPFGRPGRLRGPGPAPADLRLRGPRHSSHLSV
jgi:ornithine cyclodeaminase/alanine dehydrogenase-like protein (mu-crystallin family)